MSIYTKPISLGGSSGGGGSSGVQILEAQRSSTAQTFTNNVVTEIIFDNEVLDTNGWYDPLTGRLNPKTPVTLTIYAGVRTITAEAITSPLCQIKKNAAEDGSFMTSLNVTGAGGMAIPANGRFTFNGTTDYVSVFFYHNSGATRSTHANGYYTYMRAYT